MAYRKHPSVFSRTTRWALGSLSLAVLAACGGGGDDDPAPGPVTKRVVTGQVAVGALVSGAEIFLGCATGGSVATVISGTNGNFEITLKEGTTLPCVGQARLPGGTTMLSIIPGGNPPVINVNFTPLTDAFSWSILAGTGNGNTSNPTDIVGDANSLTTRTLDSRMTFNTAKSDFTNYFTSKTGIQVTSASFDFLSDPIVVGQPADNALEEMRNVNVPTIPNDPLSPHVPLLGPDGTLSGPGRDLIKFDAPILSPSDIVSCSAPGNSCGGDAGRLIVITGGSGS